MIHKISFVVLCLFTLTTTIRAQSSIDWSIKIGINNSIVGDYVDRPGAIINSYNQLGVFALGAIGSYAFTKRLSLSSGLQYSPQKGEWEYFHIPLANPPRVQVALHLLNVPLHIDYEILKKFRLGIGGAAGYLLGANINTDEINNLPPIWVEGSNPQTTGNKIEISWLTRISYATDRSVVALQYGRALNALASIYGQEQKVEMLQLSYQYLLFKSKE